MIKENIILVIHLSKLKQKIYNFFAIIFLHVFSYIFMSVNEILCDCANYTIVQIFEQ